jgi:hypothetical protein
VQKLHCTTPTPYDRHRPLNCVNDPYRLLCSQMVKERSTVRFRNGLSLKSQKDGAWDCVNMLGHRLCGLRLATADTGRLRLAAPNTRPSAVSRPPGLCGSIFRLAAAPHPRDDHRRGNSGCLRELPDGPETVHRKLDNVL